VPWYYAPLAYLAKFAPWLADWIISRRQIQRMINRESES
jgi:hypothetical protein